MSLFWQIFESPWGSMLIVCNHRGLVRVSLPGSPTANILNSLCETRETILTFRTTRLIDQTQRQLEEYFLGQRQNFRLELAPVGTDFQLNVWSALRKTPFGETRCYQDMAALIGNPQAMRAVGMANNKNPLPIIVPCHRVIGKKGDLVGFGGGLDLKQKLLDFEKSVVLKNKSKTTSHSLQLSV